MASTPTTPTGGQIDVTLKSYLQLIGDNNAGKNSISSIII